MMFALAHFVFMQTVCKESINFFEKAVKAQTASLWGEGEKRGQGDLSQSIRNTLQIRQTSVAQLHPSSPAMPLDKRENHNGS